MKNRNHRLCPVFLCWMLCAFFMSSKCEAQLGVLVDSVRVNPKNYSVSVLLTNTSFNWYYCLIAYDGLPVGPYSPAPRARVSACVQASGNTMWISDISAPMSSSGRTYRVAMSCCSSDCSIYSLNQEEFYAPYPTFSNLFISASAFCMTNSTLQLQITYSEKLRTNIVLDAALTNLMALYRLMSTNDIPTNAVLEKSTDGKTWQEVRPFL
jgi:hypothetical protein